MFYLPSLVRLFVIAASRKAFPMIDNIFLFNLTVVIIVLCANVEKPDKTLKIAGFTEDFIVFTTLIFLGISRKTRWRKG